MEKYIIYYFITGLLWTTYWQTKMDLTWGARIRYTLLWPVTLTAMDNRIYRCIYK